MPYMQRFLLGFCCGAVVLALPWQADGLLPRWLWTGGAAGVVLALCLTLRQCCRGGGTRRLAWAGIPLGLTWSGLAHDAALTARLQAEGSGITVTIAGRVLDEPVTVGIGRDGEPAKRFQALVVAERSRAGASEAGGAGADVVGTRVRLTWYGAPDIGKGDVWRWTAVLRAPWSYANPGGFDYERWLLGADLQATGYVRGGVRLRAAVPGLVDGLRASLQERMHGLGLPHGGVLLALLIGRGQEISQASWDTLRVTGTVHLMVISGLHVSLAAALGFAAGRLAGRLLPLLPLWLDVRVAGCLTGAMVALAYVTLAGAGIPALRALVMSGATLALLARGRTGRLGSGLLLALSLLLAVQPLAIHQQGFWLSFAAVAILYLCLGHRHGDPGARALLRGQLALSVGMLPMVAAGTGALPWTSLAANLVAVPVMSMLIVPLVLLGGCLGSVCAVAAEWLWWLADRVVGGVLWWLEWLAQAPRVPVAGGLLAVAVAQTAALCWLLGSPRWQLPALALCWVLPLAAPARGIAHGEYRVMALDVGQGTAVAVDTRRHRLLFDAGPAFPGGFEAGSAVVVPSLAATGPPRLDTLVLSHDDIDHVGGAAAVLASLTPRRVLRSTTTADGPEAASAAREPGAAGEICHGRRWRWDGVTFSVLDVPRPRHAADNDRSCILLVDDGRYRTLIAGDVSSRVEAGLLRVLAGHAAPVQLMFAPHHGSVSSSSTALVRVLKPKLVIVNAGWGNRFGHPHPAVVERYHRVGARVYQTGREGALIWRSRKPGRIEAWRRERAPYWRGRDTGGAASRR